MNTRKTQNLTDLLAGERLPQTLLWLCDIPSPIGEEEAICDSVQARLSKLTLPRARRYGNSLVVPVTRGRGPKIALVGHLDTVRTENGPARIEGDRCFGSGAADMKSGLAVMIVLAETLELASLPCELTMVFYAREEGPFAENELGPVLEQDPELSKIDLAVCMEPSDNKLHLGCGGSLHAQVTFEGRTAHSARPWEGESAISKAAPFLNELAALEPKKTLIDGLTYRTVTTVTQAKDGGRGRNVVPDRFVLNVNHRFSPDTSIAQAKLDLDKLVGKRAEIVMVDESPAAMPNAKHPLVVALSKCGVRGIEPKLAWTDVARFGARGIAAVNFGPGENAQAHQKNESTSLELVKDGFAMVRRWLTTLPA